MLYLLTGRNPACLSRAPFEADCTFGEEYALPGRRCYLPHCLHAFVGADTTCALLAGGMLEKQETALMCDIGTNGEIALWHRGQLYVASTAAGPAFEGTGISCGCGSIPGAIDRVRVEHGALHIHTIGGRKPVGLCGSGLVDAVAALLEMGIIDETGAMEDAAFLLAEGVQLTRRDVRALQLAKAAMAAGMDSLLHAAGCPAEDVAAVYLAGGLRESPEHGGGGTDRADRPRAGGPGARDWQRRPGRRGHAADGHRAVGQDSGASAAGAACPPGRERLFQPAVCGCDDV